MAFGSHAPGAILDMLPDWLNSDKGKILSTSEIGERQAVYQEDVMKCLPSEVPDAVRKSVAQAVLEALVFAGGLSRICFSRGISS